MQWRLYFCGKGKEELGEIINDRVEFMKKGFKRRQEFLLA